MRVTKDMAEGLTRSWSLTSILSRASRACYLWLSSSWKKEPCPQPALTLRQQVEDILYSAYLSRYLVAPTSSALGSISALAEDILSLQAARLGDANIEPIGLHSSHWLLNGWSHGASRFAIGSIDSELRQLLSQTKPLLIYAGASTSLVHR